MDFSESFVAAVRPSRVYQSKQFIINRTRTGYSVQAGARAPVETANTEAEMWQLAYRACPALIDELASSEVMVDRALAVRGDLFLTGRASALEAAEEVVDRTVSMLHDTVIHALGASRITRAKVSPRRSRPSQNVSYLYVESKLRLPYDKVQHFMVLEALPCALDASCWGMRVRLGATTNEVFTENCKRLDEARRQLADKGILIRDVVSGTNFADSV